MADASDYIARIVRRTVTQGMTAEMDERDQFVLLLRLSAVAALAAIDDPQVKAMLARVIESETQV